ncbi:tripartite tricarboxylate transporter substrate binding protein (plasmid) [Paroceanicella profunda]|uniref:Tripartite tricarboxylate transporter substrate binding protein n=1 Tax=Paroceanicella profunda TaxID=2579971 RepID=A0A5B8FZU1_9RHOB|nr:tripartite tricarboxylate transporter substrate binding protein [Paroceanicella profunda]QDL93985.1 tripartite tricarboxylate transporter substrate binding protein [Paroceanicella profunda]
MTELNRRRMLALAGAAGAAAALPGTLKAATYPDRPVTLIVPWGAGGGTDATARMIGTLLEEKLGQPFNVVNRTGGSGVVGHSAIATAKPDGYTIGLITVEITMMHYLGLTQLGPKDYTPLGMMNADPAGVQVSTDSAWTTIEELADAIKASKPGELKASGTGQGGIWHLALIGWLQSMGLDANHVRWVPSEGSAAGMQDLVAGGVDIVPCSLPEARSMIDAGRARSLALMAETRDPNFPDVPTLKESLDLDYTLNVWRGMAGPLDMPAEVSDVLAKALAEIAASEQYTSFMAGRGFGVRHLPPAEFAAFMEKSDAQMGESMTAAGLARD